MVGLIIQHKVNLFDPTSLDKDWCDKESWKKKYGY